jgi:Arc/MetJ-type ribon-helix-helix transcriptional regulator
MGKVKITVTVDRELNEMANMKYKNKSDRINELLKIDLFETDEKAKLIEELSKTKRKEKIITKKLCELEKEEKNLKGNDDNIEKVLEWARNTFNRRGFLGLNYLEKECKSNKVDLVFVKNQLVNEGVEFVNFDG